MKKILSLFLTFFKIGLFTFGGGYAMLSLISDETVTKKKWVTNEELLDIIAVAESTPGPISINCATYIGYKKAGFFGSLFATLGVILPSFVIIFVISFFIERFLAIGIIAKAFKGIQAAVAVLIIRAGFKMLRSVKKDVVSIALLVVALGVTVTLNFVPFDLSSIYLILLGGAVGLVYYGFIRKDARAKLAPIPAASAGATVCGANSDGSVGTGQTREDEDENSVDGSDETEIGEAKEEADEQVGDQGDQREADEQ